MNENCTQSIASMEYANIINIVSIISNSWEVSNDYTNNNNKAIIGIVFSKYYLFPNVSINRINNINNNAKSNNSINIIIVGDIKSAYFRFDECDQSYLLYKSFFTKRVLIIMIIDIIDSSAMQIVFGIYHLFLNGVHLKIIILCFIVTGNNNNIDGDIKSNPYQNNLTNNVFWTFQDITNVYNIYNSLEVLSDSRNNYNKVIIVDSSYYVFTNENINRINNINNNAKRNNSINIVTVGDIKSSCFGFDARDQSFLYQSRFAKEVLTTMIINIIDSTAMQIVFGICHLFLNGVYLKIVLCFIVTSINNIDQGNIASNLRQNGSTKMYFAVFKILEILVLIVREILNPIKNRTIFVWFFSYLC